MNNEQIINMCSTVIPRIKRNNSASALMSEAKELIISCIGKNNSFYKELDRFVPTRCDAGYLADEVKAILESFQHFIEMDYVKGISIQRQAQLDVVSDFMSQANMLLVDKKIHPAISIALGGASLEEFLRNWVEDADLLANNMKQSLDSYSKALRSNELITKQDLKDITSWAGLRNSAAHGHWEEVSDSRRAVLMLEGISLFMRKYS
ncbi:hypothetical protein QUF55_05925 [Clostridiaceae bacterium HSG29]|nr:hypothetical protein [Clostridiaceae bacterium HSG29]